MSQVNAKFDCKFFVKRYTVKRGAMVFGKLMPVGIGAADRRHRQPDDGQAHHRQRTHGVRPGAGPVARRAARTARRR